MRSRCALLVVVALAVITTSCTVRAPQHSSTIATPIQFAVPKMYSGKCDLAFGQPVGLTLTNNSLIAFSRNGVIEWFENGVLGPKTMTHRACFDSRTVVQPQSLETASSVLVGTDSSIAFLDEGKTGKMYVSRVLDPIRDPGQRLTSFAVERHGKIVVATSKNAPPVKTFILEYAPDAVGRAQPLRKFLYPAQRPISSIALDRSGSVITYDMSGTINVFAFDSDRAPRLVQSIRGPLTTLTQARKKVIGRHPMFVGADGDIVAATDRTVVFFARSASGDVKPRKSVVVGDSDDLIDGMGVDGKNRLIVLTHSVNGDEAPIISIYKDYRFLKSGARAVATKEDYLNTSFSGR